MSTEEDIILKLIGIIVTLTIIWLLGSVISWNITWFIDSWVGRLIALILTLATIDSNFRD